MAQEESFIFDLIINLQEEGVFQAVQGQVAGLATRVEDAANKLDNLQAGFNEVASQTEELDELDVDIQADGPGDVLLEIQRVRDQLFELRGQDVDIDLTTALNELSKMEQEAQNVANRVAQMGPAAQEAGGLGQDAFEGMQQAQVKTTVTSQSLIRAFQDIEFGIMAMQNNIERFALGMARNMEKGNTFGQVMKQTFASIVTGPLGIVALIGVVTTLANSWDEVTDAVRNFDDTVESAAFTLRRMVGAASDAEANARDLRAAIEEEIEVDGIVEAVDIISDTEATEEVFKDLAEERKEEREDEIAALERGKEIALDHFGIEEERLEQRKIGQEQFRENSYEEIQQARQTTREYNNQIGELENRNEELDEALAYLDEEQLRLKQYKNAFQELSQMSREEAQESAQRAVELERQNELLEQQEDLVEELSGEEETRAERLERQVSELRDDLVEEYHDEAEAVQELDEALEDFQARRRERIQADLEAEIHDVRIEMMEEGISREVATIQQRFDERRQQIKEEYPEEFELRQELLEQLAELEDQEIREARLSVRQDFWGEVRDVESEALSEEEEMRREHERRMADIIESAQQARQAIREDDREGQLRNQAMLIRGMVSEEERLSREMEGLQENRREQRLQEVREEFQQARETTRSEIRRMENALEADRPEQSLLEMVLGTPQDPQEQLEQRLREIEVQVQGDIMRIQDELQRVEGELEETEEGEERDRLKQEEERLQQELEDIQRRGQRRRQQARKEAQAERVSLMQDAGEQILSNAHDAASGFFETWQSTREEELKEEGKTAEEREEILKEEGRTRFQIMKTLKIAQATASGIESTVHAYNFGSTLGGPPLGAAMAATAGAATAAKINKLRQLSIGDKINVSGTAGDGGGGSESLSGEFQQLSASDIARREGRSGTPRASRSINIRGPSISEDRLAEKVGKEVGRHVPDSVEIDRRASESITKVGGRRSKKLDK